MRDRISSPGQEGRVLITPEGGTPYYAIMEMADNPIEPGTPLNKGTLLADDTATLLKLSGEATVNDALASLFRLPLSQRSGGIARAGSAQNGIVTYSTVDIDNLGGALTGSSSRIAVPAMWGGRWFRAHASAVVSGSTSTSNTILYLYKNGENYKTMTTAVAANQVLEYTSGIFKLNAGDYLEVYFAAAGTSQTIYTLAAGSTFGVEMVG